MQDYEVINDDNNYVYNYESKTIIKYLKNEQNIIVPSTIAYVTTDIQLSVSNAIVEHIGDRAFA